MQTQYETISANPRQVPTFAAYRQHRRAEYLADNPDLSGAEYDRSTPYDYQIGEWADMVHDAAHDGGTIPARVLDDLYRRAPDSFWSMLHDHRQCLPAGYLNPEARDANARHEAEMRQARVNGRARVVRGNGAGHTREETP